ncbi:ribonuclease HII [Propylenella binzhouense]|uniref:Ribonuclease HII n=1 Tax=Propylenella binzhouense TaxID=2555902 RepID=A0A964T4E2_9HYPH|nr:ribonuclease HII [Propylenella binzhouense]MYZ47699.1 ribonuclease HII [Propylenella binzhouense]
MVAVRATTIQADFEVERQLIAAGFRRVAGIDEAGRGPLAGPVVAAAVILDPARIPDGIADSKALEPASREALFAEISATAEMAVAFGCVGTVDRINIREATLQAMRRALGALPRAADAVLIDGRDVPRGIAIETRAIIDGDALSLSIAAASIVAKVIRDRLMTRCDGAFGGYGLASHKGYSTKLHQAALTALGPCRLHRRSFSPVAALLAQG